MQDLSTHFFKKVKTKSSKSMNPKILMIQFEQFHPCMFKPTSAAQPNGMFTIFMAE